MKNIVKFKRLLKISKPTIITSQKKGDEYTIEVENNGVIELYLSHSCGGIRVFEKKENCKKYLQNRFKNLSDHCLIEEATDLSSLLENSNVTHFEKDCPNLIYGNRMFASSPISKFKSSMPKAENLNFMFFNTKKLKSVKLKIDNLNSADYMFYTTIAGNLNLSFKKIESFESAFSYANIKKLSLLISSTNPHVFNKTFYSSEINHANIKINSLKIIFKPIFEDSNFKHLEFNSNSVTESNSLTINSSISNLSLSMPKLKYGFESFLNSNFDNINVNTPNIKNTRYFFQNSTAKSMKINAPKLENGKGMFYRSTIDFLEGDFPNIKEANKIFADAKINDFPKKLIKQIICLHPDKRQSCFENPTKEFREKYPFAVL